MKKRKERPIISGGGPLHRGRLPKPEPKKKPEDAVAVFSLRCPVCRHGKALLSLQAWEWHCGRCDAVGHWTVHMTAHPLQGSIHRKAA